MTLKCDGNWLRMWGDKYTEFMLENIRKQPVWREKVRWDCNIKKYLQNCDTGFALKENSVSSTALLHSNVKGLVTD
jgi:hypothetical protein